MKKIVIMVMVFILSITLIGCKKNIGKIYGLKEAYELNYLTKEDLKSIAYYYNGFDDSGFTPKPKNPKSISKRNEKLIKKAYLYDELKNPKLGIKKISIYKYYGTYNGCIVIGVTDTYNCYDYYFYDEYIIGDVSFYDFTTADLRVYVPKKGV